MVKLALLWHMHQPYYEDLATGEHILPWVRLHATKDYWGMVAMLSEFPRIHATVNLVPSLLVQIEAFAADRAQDRHLLIGLKPADLLDAAERRFLVANGFHAPVDRAIRPQPRYGELYAKRQRPDAFSADDLRDLQVWHKLVWMDPDRLSADPRLKALVAKGRSYTESDKQQLRAVELELLQAVIPAYRAAAATGRIELTTSPFYHPILPLLCDTDAHLRAHPHSALPGNLFAYPEDAREQLARAFDYHRRVFGSQPRGIWPSEGSVSDEVIELLAEAGVEWAATDEKILARSLDRTLTAPDLYRPYIVGRGARTVRVLFRDHQLSDLIGFTYQSWDAEAAAMDFVTRVRDVGRRFKDASGGEDAIVTVILDGENAWEHYAGGGRPFLRRLYQRLQEATDIQTVTMSVAAAGVARPLPSIFPGSWIDGDFYIWAGHRDDHRAWGQLAAARRVFEQDRERVTPEARDRAREELLIAEGSDWFWWYGDDHSSDHDREFDELFRRHVRNAYRALGRPAPDDLHVSNITTLVSGGPLAIGVLTTPAIDGRSVDFTQWASAVEVPLGGGGGTMHRVAGQLVRALRVTADRQALYLRIDGGEFLRRVLAREVGVALLQDRPVSTRLEVAGNSHGPESSRPNAARPVWAADDVMTIGVPFAMLQAQPGDRVSLSLLVTDAGRHVIEQHPANHPFEVEVPGPQHDAVNWLV
jgi:alpha-amylase/alpha-mannosidase (GH57 family)